MRDEELLRLLKKDPERGMDILINEYSSLLYAVVKAKFQNGEYYSSDIEDCVSDTFTKFYLELDRYRLSKGSVASYLCVMARNRAIDVARKRGVELAHMRHEDETLFQIDDMLLIGEELISEEIVSEIVSEISNLGYPDKEVIYRKFYLSQSSAQIAKALNISETNVNVRVHRVIKKLREKFGGKQ